MSYARHRHRNKIKYEQTIITRLFSQLILSDKLICVRKKSFENFTGNSIHFKFNQILDLFSICKIRIIGNKHFSKFCKILALLSR